MWFQCSKFVDDLYLRRLSLFDTYTVFYNSDGDVLRVMAVVGKMFGHRETRSFLFNGAKVFSESFP